MQSDVAITVRAGAPSDHRSLVQIDEYAVSHFDRVTAIADALAAGECLVAESDQETLGYVVLNYTFFGFGFIPVIVVAAAHRRHGIGLRLLSEARSRCTSRKLFTSANASNIAAQKLFARAGFTRSGTIENLDEGDPEFMYFTQCGQASSLTTRWSGPWGIAGRVWPRHRHRGRPLNSVVRRTEEMSRVE